MRSEIEIITGHDEFQSKQHPWEVHSLELCSEPEGDDCILVYLAPDIQDGHNPGVHQDHEVEEEADYDRQDQVEQQHEAVVSWSSIEYSSFQSQTIKRERRC